MAGKGSLFTGVTSSNGGKGITVNPKRFNEVQHINQLSVVHMHAKEANEFAPIDRHPNKDNIVLRRTMKVRPFPMSIVWSTSYAVFRYLENHKTPGSTYWARKAWVFINKKAKQLLGQQTVMKAHKGESSRKGTGFGMPEKWDV